MIPISEIFGPTIQGEGPLAGRRVMFVRTGGCDYRCGMDETTGEWTMPWRCDTLYAVLPEHKGSWTKMDAGAVLGRLNELSGGERYPVILSGGNPALHQGIGDLLAYPLAQGWEFHIETQGTVWPAWAPGLTGTVVAPKPPSSGMVFHEERQRQLRRWLIEAPAPHLKIAVATPEDLVWACEIADLYPWAPFYLVPCNTEIALGGGASPATVGPGYTRLVDACLASGAPAAAQRAILLPQLHALAWGTARGH